MNREKQDLTQGRLGKQILFFSLPLMISNVLQVLFNMSDIAVVGRFAGSTALGAVGSTTILVTLFTGFLIGVGTGVNVLVARCFGARSEKDTRATVHTSLLIMGILGILLLALGELFATQMLRLLNTKEELLEGAALYLRIYFLGMPATMVYNFGAALLRAVGDTRRPLYYLFSAGVINVILNLFFVIVCRLDVAGVAIATVISQCVSAVLVVRCMMRESGAVHLELRQLRIWKGRLVQILQVGLPAGFQGVLFALSNVVIQSSINSFGEIVVAGNAAAANIESFVYVSMNAFHQANVSFTSQNLGAGRYDRIRPILLRAQGCVIVVGLFLGGAATLFGPQLLGIYSDSDAVIAAGMDRLSIICATHALCGMMDVMVGSLRGLGYSVMPMLVSLIGACGLRLIWITAIFRIPEYHTVQTVYWSYPVSWIITFLAHLICFFWAMGRLKHRFPEKTLRAN